MSLAAFGLPADATESDLKDAYRRLAMKAHPDRGGTSEQFQYLTLIHQAALEEVRAPLDCPACHGTKMVKYQNNSWGAPLTMMCGRCNGQGVLQR